MTGEMCKWHGDGPKLSQKLENNLQCTDKEWTIKTYFLRYTLYIPAYIDYDISMKVRWILCWNQIYWKKSKKKTMVF